MKNEDYIRYFGIVITESSFKNSFAEKLKQIRKEKGITQCDMAMLCSVPASTYANWEQGRREPSLFNILKILYILNISANELFVKEVRKKVNINE